MRYYGESNKKANGVVYTPSEMADYVAQQMIKYHGNIEGSTIHILDPAVGSGNLLIAMIKALNSCGKKIVAVGYETDNQTSKETERKLAELFPNVSFNIRTENFIDAVSKGNVGKYDYVIANPPYVRTQIMGSDKAKFLADSLSLTGRVDLYYAFLVCTKYVLKDKGIAGYITSNKYMTIKGGEAVRNFIIDNYKIYQIVDLGDTKLFNAAVLPSLIFFSNGKTLEPRKVAFTSVYEHQGKNTKDNLVLVNGVFDAIEKNGTFIIPDGRVFDFQQGTLNSVNKGDVWTIDSTEKQEWLSKVEAKTWITFDQIGKIRVGIKTTADNVFIRDKWEGSLSDLELLRPLITHRNSGQIVCDNNSLWKVLYTHHMKNGKKEPYNIDEFPKTKAYLVSHYEQLSGREYLRKANRNWYEIWVPQNPNAWKHRKIVFRDISEKPQFWFDDSGAVVNGDCYWIDIDPHISEEVVYLALAVANSSFIEKFYDAKFNTKLYSGKRRYQTQYVEQFPIPYYDSDEALQAISLVKKIIAGEKDETVSSYKKQINTLVGKMFS